MMRIGEGRSLEEDICRWNEIGMKMRVEGRSHKRNCVENLISRTSFYVFQSKTKQLG